MLLRRGVPFRAIRRSVRLAASAAVITLLSTLSAAVQTPPVPGEAGLRDARVPDSVPNISGVWQTRGYERKIKPVDAADPPWQPWNKEQFAKRAAAEEAGNPLYDPTADCLPSGVPRIIAAPYPVEIIQTAERTVFLHEVQHVFASCT